MLKRILTFTAGAFLQGVGIGLALLLSLSIYSCAHH